MTTILTEKTRTGELTFEFSDKWQACQYDELPFYSKLRGRGLKGVDFIALSNKGLLLMEVKFVTATNENSRLRFYVDTDKDKLSKRPYLADEVTKKVRDTVLGLFASYRNEEIILSSYSQSLFTSNNQPILVLLFLERNTELNKEENFKPLASDLKLAIEQKLSFLGNIQVGVVNSLTLPSALEIKILENTSSSSL